MDQAPNSTKRRTALITGASAGIGRELALVFAHHGHDLVLVARRADRLEALAQEVKVKFGVKAHVIVADLADPAAPRKLFDEVAARHIMIDALVNNAGYTVPGFFRDTKWSDQAALIQVMVTVVAELCHLFGPGMAARNYGRIINVASLAGHLPGAAGGTLYAASKSFVIKMSESLSLEYQNNNVYVTALCPGFTYSEFHDVAGNRAEVSKFPKILWMDGDVVANQAYDAVMDGKAVIINGRLNNVLAWLARVLPQVPMRNLMARNQRNAKAKT
ncbi:MAG: SDR family oxidoreductase [Parvibaculum sp.]|nr:SDR family oxidoreductase [Parvibaculum sp.]